MMTQFRGLSSSLRIAPRNLALSHSLPPTPDLLSIPCHAVTVVTTYLYLTMISEQAEENNAVDFVGEFLARSAIHIVFAILKYLVWKLIQNQTPFFVIFFVAGLCLPEALPVGFQGLEGVCEGQPKTP